MKRIATLDVPKSELALIQHALDSLEDEDIRYELVAAGQDIRVASAVFLNGASERAKELWVRLRKWAPAGSVTGIVLGAQTGPMAVAADNCLQRPLNIDDVVSMLKLLYVRSSTQTVSKHQDDAAPPIAINNGRRAKKSVREEPLRLRGQVLIVDDSVTVRRHMKFALSRFGLDVDTAESGEEGLKRIVQSRYDLVFLDVVMPGADGFEICKTLKSSRDLRKVPVVMLTSRSSPFNKVRGALSGCDSYLTKPVELGLLQDVLGQHLSCTLEEGNGEESCAATVVIEPIDFEGAEA